MDACPSTFTTPKRFFQNTGIKNLCIAFISVFLQGPLCSTSQVECINRIQFDSPKSTCAKSCSGLIVTGVSKSEQDMNKNIEGILSEEMTSYDDFTKWKPFQPFLKGRFWEIYGSRQINIFVKIYFTIALQFLFQNLNGKIK